MRNLLAGLAILAGQSGLALAQDGVLTEGLPLPFAPAPYSPYVDRAFPTDVFFGDTHVHTALSTDAGGAGARLMPRDSYRFALGEEVISSTGQPVRLSRPLDFYMITDHSDGMGAIIDILKGTPNIMAEPYGAELHNAFNTGGKVAAEASKDMIGRFAQGTVPAALVYGPGNPAYRKVWEDIVAAAEEFNDPGHFTTFAAFEWTSLVAGNNLHRNVIFRDGPERTLRIEPFVTTAPTGSPDPRKLWDWLQAYEVTTGGRVLAIPHNGNLSNGMMFPLVDEFAGGVPLDADYAVQRQKWERLYEATQYKGDGEVHPMLSPEDEFAGFELWDNSNLDISVAKTPEMLPGEYVRSGLQRGLALEKALGVNPYKFGLVGGTDTHNGLTTIEEDNFFGKFVSYEPNPGRATHLSGRNAELGLDRWGWQLNAAGLAAVWAEENTREAVFDAMARRETYATTGPRMRVRFFGGWEFTADDIKSRQLARIGYHKGVPMGADMRPRPEGAGAPSFLVFAMRDPMGANLDRVQVIKGWIGADGTPMEKVYDVAWSDNRLPGADGKLPPVGDTVDLSIPSWTNTIGAAELGAVWTDPDFDPALSAFYYARVIEIPTPRWTAYDAVKFGLDLPPEIPLKTQERAYTSPIWYSGSEG